MGVVFRSVLNHIVLFDVLTSPQMKVSSLLQCKNAASISLFLLHFVEIFPLAQDIDQNDSSKRLETSLVTA